MPDNFYHEKIIKFARSSRLRIPIENPIYTAKVSNPLCGDRVTIDFAIEENIIKTIGLNVRACALCEAASEVLAVQSVGCEPKDLVSIYESLKTYLSGTQKFIPWDDLTMFEPVRAVTARHDCVLLPFAAANKAFQ